MSPAFTNTTTHIVCITCAKSVMIDKQYGVFRRMIKFLDNHKTDLVEEHKLIHTAYPEKYLVTNLKT